MIYSLIGFIVIGTCFLVASAFYLKTGLFKSLYHDLMGWCQPDDSPKWSDGCSIHAKCKYCGKDIMQDSQGNWF